MVEMLKIITLEVHQKIMMTKLIQIIKMIIKQNQQLLQKNQIQLKNHLLS